MPSGGAGVSGLGRERGSRLTSLRRDLGVFAATMLGLGSILGTGVFVSLGLAAGAAGPAVLAAIAIAALVATCNALSSAQLAANFPVSGGTYEYGYRTLHPALGFTAGWMFLAAKTASAATAALGVAGYLLRVAGLERTLLVPVALVVCLLVTIVVLSGMRRSSAVNIVIVTITLAALGALVVAGFAAPRTGDTPPLSPFFSAGIPGLLQATALMFVAYTGYARIATLGEEVREPRRTIPRAIIATLVVSALLYLAVGFVAVTTVGSDALSRATRATAAPLELVAATLGHPWLVGLVTLGAVTAMLGVLLNLLLGLSRVALAMGRRGDLPRPLARIDAGGRTPTVAVVTVASVVAALALTGDVKTTWGFSAFTVLVYYAITNLAALRLPSSDRLYSPIVAWCGLAACLFLAFWVEPRIWLVGLGLIAAGLLWHAWSHRHHR